MIDLILGDCEEILKNMDENLVDLTVTSPPYDNLRSYKDTNGEWGEEKWKKIIKELHRVTKKGGVVVWVVGDATINGSETGTSFRQALWAMECGFNLHDTMIWRKTNPPPQTIEGRRYTSAFEYMFVLVKDKLKTYNPLEEPNKTAGKAHKNIGTQRKIDGTFRMDRVIARQETVVKETRKLYNIWDFAKQGQGSLHPAQFPKKIAQDHILSWSNKGDLVLDPFMGSGTTGKMAKFLNRRFIGIEKVPEYFKIAKRRIEDDPTRPANSNARHL